MSDTTMMYRTHQVWIKPGHRLFTYLDEACHNAKNLYNTANFFIRQVFTSYGRKEPLQPLQQQVIHTLETQLEAMNERRSVTNRSRPFELPSQEMIRMIQYKAAEQGIAVMLTEEAYTSKASFPDHDPLPRYGEERTWTFSGKRIHRGLYRSKKGVIHADVNGAANIMRKVFPNVCAKSTDGIEELDGSQSVNVSTPLVLSILKSVRLRHQKPPLQPKR